MYLRIGETDTIIQAEMTEEIRMSTSDERENISKTSTREIDRSNKHLK